VPHICSPAVIALTDAALKVSEQQPFPQSGLIRLFYNYETWAHEYNEEHLRMFEVLVVVIVVYWSFLGLYTLFCWRKYLRTFPKFVVPRLYGQGEQGRRKWRPVRLHILLMIFTNYRAKYSTDMGKNVGWIFVIVVVRPTAF